MIYVLITLVVLILLNFYCSSASQMIFYQSKKTAMTEKCQLASNEIAQLEVIHADAISTILEQMGNLNITRVTVTDQNGRAIYDSLGVPEGTFLLFPEIVQSLKGNDVFSWHYHAGSIQAQAAIPTYYNGTIVGCVYMREYDLQQGKLILSLQNTVLQITLVLEILILLFSLIFSRAFSRRMRKIMASMRIIQEGDYTHKVTMGGSDELKILADEVNDLTERLNTSEQKRRRFVSDASHELKTPLASIKLLTDSILQNEMDAETVREFVGDIGNEAERLNRMTEKLLSMTKVDGQLPEDSQIILIAPTVRRVTKMLSPAVAQAGITVHLELDQDSPILILEDDLYQIVFNLMENGIKYNIPGGTLTVSLGRDEDNALLTVRDSGVGIPADALEHIFERFFRVDKARSRATGGSGLGLAIVRAIVERSKGEITVESTPGQGTAFTVSFPAFDTEVDPI